MRLYLRPSDMRSRFLCITMRPARARKHCVAPLTFLDVERSGPFLKFLRVSTSNRSPQLWACLKFLSYESQSKCFVTVTSTGGADWRPELVLFFCSFVALRSEEPVNQASVISDSELHNEKELFGGCVQTLGP